ncbi:MAG: hypothetical protein ABW187_07185 [Dokdonella sp.]
MLRRLVAASLLFAAVVASAAETPPVATLPGERAFPESITSTSDGTLYAGSLAGGGVFRVRPGAAQAEIWIKPGAFGSRSIFGVLADEKAAMLWACSNDLSALGVVLASGESGSWLKGFDLKTGKGKVSVKLSGEHTLCNDIAIAADGSVFVTNTMAPEILALSADRKRLDVWASDPLFPAAGQGAGLDGIAFGGDGNLYVDTYTKAELFRVDVDHGKAGKVAKLALPRTLVLADALRLVEGTTFLLVEGGGRLDRVVVDGDAATVETLKDDFALPTGVTRVGGKTAWVSEGQLSSIFDPSKKDQKPNLPFRLYAVPLTPP